MRASATTMVSGVALLVAALGCSDRDGTSGTTGAAGPGGVTGSGGLVSSGGTGAQDGLPAVGGEVARGGTPASSGGGSAATGVTGGSGSSLGGGAAGSDPNAGTGGTAFEGVHVSTASFSVDRQSVSAGDTVHGSVTLLNDGTETVTLINVVIAGRAPGATHAGGPMSDLTPTLSDVTLAPGERVTLEASRSFTAVDALGSWELYPTYEDASGWHDLTGTSLEVVQVGTGGSGGGGSGGAPGTGGGDTGTCPTGWALAWSDEFNGPAGAAVDTTKWAFDTGGNGWGNNELEYYTDDTGNAAHDGSGNLVITARRESFGGREYTSARLKTQGVYTFTHGRVEGRMKLPYGQGIWPAFWMLGEDIGTASWPGCGEIDIMENIGREPSMVHGTIHGPGYSGGSALGASYTLGAPAANDFHVFAIEWETNVIRWYVDDVLYSTKTPADLPAGTTWVYEHPFFLILNVAVGGAWPGTPDTTTVFPQQMLVDYVRVCQR